MQGILRPKDAGNFYSYIVKEAESGVIVYVGAARIHDVITFRDLLKNPEFDQSKAYEITIVNNYSNFLESRNAVATLIRDFNNGRTPILNYTTMARRNKLILCEQTGQHFKNQSECSRVLSLPQSQLSKHLSKYVGFKSVKGYTFIYV